jgi:hypothetical protein
MEIARDMLVQRIPSVADRRDGSSMGRVRDLVALCNATTAVFHARV